MNVLIIGGSRFLGLEVARQLIARGDSVTVANRGQTQGDLPEGVSRLTVDISQAGALETALEGKTFDAAIHMIAMTGDRARVVIEALEGKIGRYLQCGSVGIYAPLSRVPADETHPTHPRDVGPDGHFVGFTDKQASDEEAFRLGEAQGVPVTILRPSAIIGAGDVPLDLWGARSPACFQRIIDGEVLSLPNDGRALIQFVHVADMAASFVLALDRPEVTGGFNITSEYAVTLTYYAQILGEAVGRRPRIEYVPMMELIDRYAESGKVNERGLRFLCEHMCFTIEKARRELGYEPQWSPEAAVADSVNWMLEQGLIVRR